ncbi:hypothetical protein [Corynebacterium matruchotii]|jgi:hypothetical protein|uniref:hypothetical protein n=1 Tax=Corynebacterium matruchotii TaxID=43768 RepID=UPI00288047F7|nr:hypothetical protein [Corynebacterium matruchotii]
MMYFTSNADIIPSKSLGGITLLEPVSKYWSSIVQCRPTREKILYEMAGYHTVIYELLDYFIEFRVNMSSGLIYRISALPGYTGKFHNNITIGMPMAEVHDMNLGFEYSDLTEDFSSPLFPGLLLEPDLDDPWPEELPHVKVERIVVFDREYINKVNGSTGLSYMPW